MKEVVLPNVRKIFIPDPGWVIFDCDLSGADAQVVAWEADDDDLKRAFRAKLDIHAKNASDMWGTTFTKLNAESLAYYKMRQACKHAVHGTNYGGSARAIAMHPSINWTVHEADQFQKRWFSLHPRIKTWHVDVQSRLDASKTVENAFGYRRVYFDRPDQCFTEALAWVPQSTVALVSFLGALNLERNFLQSTPISDLLATPNPYCQMLLQNHDSIVFQIPEAHAHHTLEIKTLLEIPIPYPDPLTIPIGVSRSKISWGDCQKIKKEELQ